MTMIRASLLALLAGTCIAGAVQAATPRPLGLHLGTPRLTAAGLVAIPVRLRLPADVRVAALNFTVRWDVRAADPSARTLVAGPAVAGARADLASRADAAAGTVTAIVVPEFTARFGAIRGRRVATVFLRPSGATPQNLRRWVQRHVRLEDVVLGDPRGRELRLRGGRS